MNIVRQSSVGSAAYESMCAPTQGRGLSLVNIVKQSSERPATYKSMCASMQGKILSCECSFRLIFTFENFKSIYRYDIILYKLMSLVILLLAVCRLLLMY